MYKHLFFDDQRLYVRQGLRREYGVPEAVGSFVDPRYATPYCWCWALRGIDGKVHLLYTGHVQDENGKVFNCFGAAISDDGIAFQLRNTAAESGIDNPVTPNQFLAPSAGQGVFNSEIALILEDRQAPPSERYKLLYADMAPWVPTRHVVDSIYTSPDLVKWTLKDGAIWNTEGTEPLTGGFFNPVSGKFTILTRPDFGQRRVAVTETADWYHFTPPELCMQCDSLDDTLAEIYGMPALEYDGWFIGFPHVYSGFAQEIFVKFFGGTMNAQLAYSLNGHHWQRSLRKPFVSGEMLPDGPWKMAYLSSFLREPDGSLLLYVCSSRKEHGAKAEEMMGQSCIHVLRLRADGFIRLSTTGEEEGVLALRETCLQAPRLQINLQAKHATCAIYKFDSRGKEAWRSHEDCIPFSGDSTCWEPQWRSGDLQELVGQLVNIEVKLQDGSLYSIAYDGVPLMGSQSSRYFAKGILPTRERWF